MSRIYSTVGAGLIIGVVLALIVMAFTKKAPIPEMELLKPVSSKQATASDKDIRSAQGVIQQDSTNPQGYNLLASAFMQKARETGDFSFNVRAEDALTHSFRVAPDNYDAIKLHAAVLLNFHRFDEALQESQRALKINAGDHSLYGALVDSLVESGDYDGAVEAAQKMVDLRPDTASYSRISYLRSLHGDTKGAIQMMRMAVESANPKSPESIAWCRVHLGDELMNDGKLPEAEKEYDHALALFPDYYLALAGKARARIAANDLDGAVELYKKSVERVPLPDQIAALGDLYAKLGRTNEAKQQYDQVEFIEKTGPASGTYSRQLASFWADHDINLDEALAIAQNERKSRSDINTYDILGWCLFKKGQFDEAKNAADQALRLNTRDPKLLYHAGMIYAATGDKRKGADYLKQALAINPTFDVLQATIAQDKLTELKVK